jgi:hypothetical protein
MTNRDSEIAIININGTRSMYISNTEGVSNILVEILTSAGYSPQVITDLDTLDDLVRSNQQNLVLINAHGEAIPMHSSWEEDWVEYLTRLGILVRDQGWTLVSITGYPLFYYSRGDNVTQIQPVIRPGGQGRVNGLGTFISVAEGQVQGAFWSPVDLTMEGKSAASISDGLVLPDKLWISRCFVWLNLQPTKKFYAAGPIIGAASIPIGRGSFVYNGMMPTDFGTSTGQYSDGLLARMASFFTLSTIRRVLTGGTTVYPLEILNRIATDISNELPPLFQATPRREKQVQRQVNSILRLRYQDLDFRWDQLEFPYSSKSYKPDFVSERVNMAIDVKLCNRAQKANRIVDEINADITAYKTRFQYLLFVVYDTDRHIQNPMTFTGDFERYNAGVRVFVVR